MHQFPVVGQESRPLFNLFPSSHLPMGEDALLFKLNKFCGLCKFKIQVLLKTFKMLPQKISEKIGSNVSTQNSHIF